MKAWGFSAMSLVGCLLGGCSAEAPIGTQRTAIVAGEASGASQDGVLLLRGLLEDDSEFICSASLVAPNLVLTAQHCVSYLTDGRFACSVRGELVDSPDGGGSLGLSVPAERLEIYGSAMPRSEPLARGAQVISTHSPTICQNDLAFLLLDTALELPLLPMRIGRSAEVGELGVLVGYGQDARERALDLHRQARQQKRDLAITGVGPDSVEDGVTTVPPRTLALDGPSGCIGDSGGPLLAQSTGAILGVYSLQDGERCADPQVHHQLVHVPPFQLLIQQAFAAAGAEPLEEPMAGAAGSGNELGEAGQPASMPPPPAAPRDSGCAFSGSPPSSLTSLWLLAVAARRRRGR
jgi:hypothetical protein